MARPSVGSGDFNRLMMMMMMVRHVKQLVPVAFAVVSTHSSFKVYSQHDEKHVVPTPLSVGKG
jgi:hypothetical protein